MKMAKRILSMVMVLAMIACLSVTAFADTPAAPYIQVTVVNSRSNVTDSWTVAATTGSSVKAALDGDTIHARSWTPVPDYYDATQTHYMLSSYGGYGTMGFNKDVAADVNNLKAAGYDDESINSIQWCTGTYQGYGLVEHDEEAGTYTYIYAGYDWTYSSNLSSEIWSYMCCYNVQATEVIQLMYKFTVTDPWVRSTPLGA